MTRDVLISISGMQMIEDENDAVEMITAGEYYMRSGKHYILYEEIQEGQDGTIKNMIKIYPDSLEIIKSGSSSVHMTFEKDKKNMSCYATPFGELMIGVRTSEIWVEEEEDSIKVRVTYSLDINYQHVSECDIIIDVRSKSTADIHLLD